jgi:hypothetical protein
MRRTYLVLSLGIIAQRLLLGMLLLLVLLGCAPPAPPSEADARRLAAKALSQYSTRERRWREAFAPPTLSADGRYPWVFDYTSSTRPRHLVRIYVDSSGHVELHRLVD